MESAVSMMGYMFYGKTNGDLLQEGLCRGTAPPRTAAAGAPAPTARYCQPTPLLETPTHSGQDWLSLLQGHIMDVRIGP